MKNAIRLHIYKWSYKCSTTATMTQYIWHIKSSCLKSNTVRCRYNEINFLANIYKKHPIVGLGCLLWVHYLFDILPQYLKLFMQYITILDRVITALCCIRNWENTQHGLSPHFAKRKMWYNSWNDSVTMRPPLGLMQFFCAKDLLQVQPKTFVV